MYIYIIYIIIFLCVQVRSIRNKKLFHSKHFKVEDLKECIADMVKLLQSGELASDSSAKEAVKGLQEVIYLHFYKRLCVFA